MDLLQVMVYGGLGGLVVEFMSSWAYLREWQAARREHLRVDKQPLPRLSDYVDLPADTLVALTRIVLGALSGSLLASQVTGPIAAIAVGAAAPALLKQIGSAQSLGAAQQHAEALGEPPVPPGQVP
ncbi:hypothetical protein [Nonomuraea cavernae]|uniref:hypothetical protein n=1 Tax=Nonomuraea cavernae TaxID=2045107 RepID=UPI00340B2663